MPDNSKIPTRFLPVEREVLPLWTAESAEDLLKFIFVSPRPCEELEALLAA